MGEVDIAYGTGVRVVHHALRAILANMMIITTPNVRIRRVLFGLQPCLF